MEKKKFGASGTRTNRQAEMARDDMRRRLLLMKEGDWVCFSDGSSLGNPGRAGAAAALYQKQATPRKRDSSLKSDSLKSDSLKSDSLKSDSLKSDSLKSDSLGSERGRNMKTSDDKKNKNEKDEDQLEFVSQKSVSLPSTTNNVAELAAISIALDLITNEKSIGKLQKVTIFSDSRYAIGVLSLGWKAKSNQFLIRRIQERLQKVTCLVSFEWVAGHVGCEQNELVDRLAKAAAKHKQNVAQTSGSTELRETNRSRQIVRSDAAKRKEMSKDEETGGNAKLEGSDLPAAPKKKQRVHRS